MGMRPASDRTTSAQDRIIYTKGREGHKGEEMDIRTTGFKLPVGICLCGLCGLWCANHFFVFGFRVRPLASAQQGLKTE